MCVVNKMPLISVLMSVCNGEKYLARSVESMLNQTLDDFELIICDDASTDGTLELLNRYKERDPRVVVLHNEKNLGLGTSLNRCLYESKGEFIARMDDDDWAFENRFEKQVAFLREHEEYAFVGTNAIVFDGENDLRTMRKPEKPTLRQFVKGSPYLHPSIMFRRDAIFAVEGYSRKSYALGRAQDYELFMRMAGAGFHGYNMQEPLMRYFYQQANTQKKRSFKTVKNEMKIRWHGYRQMKAKPWHYAFVFLPLYVYVKHEIIRRVRKNG